MLGTDELMEILEDLALDASFKVLLVDGAHRVRYANPLDHGYTHDQVVGRLVEELVPDEFKERVRSAVDAALERGERTTYQTRIDSPRGPIHYRTSVGPVRSQDDHRYARFVAKEVTFELPARAAVMRERALLRTLDRVNRILIRAPTSEAGLDAVLSEMLDSFQCDRAFLLHPCDPSAAHFEVPYEQTTAEFPGGRGRKIPMTPGISKTFAWCADRMGEVLQVNFVGNDSVLEDDPVVAAFSVKSMLMTSFRPAGDTQWVLGIHHCREAKVYDEELPILGAVGARVADGIATLLAQQAMRESEERLHLLIEHAPEAIVILDVDTGRFVEVNQSAVDLFGLSRQELRARGPADVSVPVQPDGTPTDVKAREYVEGAMRGETRVFEWHHRNAKGDVLECEVRLLRLPHKRHRWLRGSILHIAERKRAERENERLSMQLAQAQKMQALGQLTGGIAHDFNNLLMVVGSSLELIERETANPARVQHFVELATDACGRAAQLTQRLLAFSRMQPLRPRAVSLRSLVRAMEALLVRTLGEAFSIEVSLADGLWSCEVDPAQLENAILNLCINARDAMPTGGRIHIEACNVEIEVGTTAQDGDEVVPGEYVRLAVTDHGEGMSPETLAKAFEPFYTTKEVGKGSGLGLSMVYGFIKQSRGHVRLQSAVARGTRVELWLPRSHGVVVSRERGLPNALKRVGQGERVLVVEDDARLRDIVLELLRQLGFRTLAADRGSVALEILAAEPDVALLLSDVVLPGGMNGVETARRAQGLRPALPVVFMSGYTETTMVRDGRLAEGFHLLEKPFTSAALATAMREALDGERPRPGSG